jgi:hypothetical protein
VCLSACTLFVLLLSLALGDAALIAFAFLLGGLSLASAIGVAIALNAGVAVVLLLALLLRARFAAAAAAAAAQEDEEEQRVQGRPGAATPSRASEPQGLFSAVLSSPLGRALVFDAAAAATAPAPGKDWTPRLQAAAAVTPPPAQQGAGGARRGAAGPHADGESIAIELTPE